MTPPTASSTAPATLGAALVLTLVLVLIASLPVSAAQAKITRSGPRASGAVALTFDDGWNGAACASIARTLRAYRVKGTFFINGNHLKLRPALWRRILKGMPVGNHTRSHRNLTLESDRIVRNQIRQNEAVHERVLRRPMLKVLRPPYGAQDRRVRRLAGELGYTHLALWSIDTRDWQGSASVGSITSRATGARAGSIILMHCARSATARALPAIIRHYKARGIKLVGLDRLLPRATFTSGKERKTGRKGKTGLRRPTVEAAVAQAPIDSVLSEPSLAVVTQDDGHTSNDLLGHWRGVSLPIPWRDCSPFYWPSPQGDSRCVEGRDSRSVS